MPLSQPRPPDHLDFARKWLGWGPGMSTVVERRRQGINNYGQRILNRVGGTDVIWMLSRTGQLLALEIANWSL
jgi:hypothetical protein